MFIAALFTIAKTWKQPKCALTDNWIRKMWCIYTMECYSAIKKNKIMPFTATWMELETLILSELSQKDKYHMISLISGIYYKAQMNLSAEKKIMDFQNRLVVAKGGSGVIGELGVSRYKLLPLEQISNEILLCSTWNDV
uniref:DUF1725 domain-containing protein n=1 Tax=Sus scrofa TaxID=9823 RepID=A0A8W4FMT1_PIG